MENQPPGDTDARAEVIARLRRLRGMSEEDVNKHLRLSDADSAALFRQAALLQEQDVMPEPELPPAVAPTPVNRQSSARQTREDAAILAVNLKDAYRLLASFVETAHHAASALDSYLDGGQISARTVKELVISLNDISRHYFMSPGEMSNPEWVVKTRRLFETLADMGRGEDYDREYFKGNHEEIVRALSRSIDPAKRPPRP